MSNYSDNPNMCRVDFFKSSGKWYTTEAVEFLSEHYHSHPNTALAHALQKHFGDTPKLSGMTAVCLHPYVENSYPISIVNIG